MSAIAITVDGVLRKPVGGQPIQAGIDLYYGMATRAKLVLLTDHEDDDKEELEYWLRIEGMHEHAQVIWSSYLWRGPADIRRVCQANEARRGGHELALVIEPDPEVSAALLQAGYSTLTFTHAQYSVPYWRPDYEHRARAWDELSAQVAREAMLKADDERLSE